MAHTTIKRRFNEKIRERKQIITTTPKSLVKTEESIIDLLAPAHPLSMDFKVPKLKKLYQPENFD